MIGPGGGRDLASALVFGARHVLVDPPRSAVPVSASMVRADPFATWQFLSPGVRAYYAKRVRLLGACELGQVRLRCRGMDVQPVGV